MLKDNLLDPWVSRAGTGLGLFLGIAAFLPIGIGYLVIMGFGLLCLSPQWRMTRLSVALQWRWLIFVFVAWPTILWFLHGADLDSLPRWAHSVRVAIYLVLALTMPSHERKLMLWGFGLGALWASGVVVVHHHLTPLPEWAIWHALLSVKGNASSQKWILLATASGIGLWFAWQSRIHPWLRTIILVIALGIGVLVASVSISRNAILILMAVPLCLVPYRYRQLKVWLPALLGAVGLAYVLWATSPTVAERLTQAVQELHTLLESGNFDGSVSVRAHMFVTAWQQLWMHPFLGTGLGSWSDIWAQASQAYPLMTGINNPHNDYLLWGMETGVPGLLILSWLLVSLALAAWQNPNRLVGGAGWMASGALFITGMVNAPFRDAALGMSLVILTAVLATWPSSTE